LRDRAGGERAVQDRTGDPWAARRDQLARADEHRRRIGVKGRRTAGSAAGSEVAKTAIFVASGRHARSFDVARGSLAGERVRRLSAR